MLNSITTLKKYLKTFLNVFKKKKTYADKKPLSILRVGNVQPAGRIRPTEWKWVTPKLFLNFRFSAKSKLIKTYNTTYLLASAHNLKSGGREKVTVEQAKSLLASNVGE